MLHLLNRPHNVRVFVQAKETRSREGRRSTMERQGGRGRFDLWVGEA